jgi:hypothetical protein
MTLVALTTFVAEPDGLGWRERGPCWHSRELNVELKLEIIE